MAIPAIHEARTESTRTVVRRTCPAGHTYISGPNYDASDVARWTDQHAECPMRPTTTEDM